MHDHRYHEDPEELAKAMSQGYEHRDVSSSRFGRIGIIFAIFTILAAVLALGAMRAIYWVQNRENLTYRSVPEARKKLPAGPLLQSNTSVKEDILKLRAAAKERLTTSGVDAETGKRHIPIDQAIDELAARGLPVAASAQTQPGTRQGSTEPPGQAQPQGTPGEGVGAPRTQPSVNGPGGSMRPEALGRPGQQSDATPAIRGGQRR